jgi:hypothetical protein
LENKEVQCVIADRAVNLSVNPVPYRWRYQLKKGRVHAVAGVCLSLVLTANSIVGCAATPTVTQVLEVCARAAANGHQGVDATTCEWYTMPCACKVGRSDSDAEPWCIPAGESTERTVLKVVGELRRLPDKQTPIDEVAPGILARLYPCGDATIESNK